MQDQGITGGRGGSGWHPSLRLKVGYAQNAKLDGFKFDASSDLLLGQVADYRQLIHLALVRFDHKNDPDDEAREPEDWPNEYGQKSQKRHMCNDAQSDGYNTQSDIEEYALPGVKAHETVSVIRFDHEKNNGGDDGEVGQHSGNVIGEA
jgi:hypothetical protein